MLRLSRAGAVILPQPRFLPPPAERRRSGRFRRRPHPRPGGRSPPIDAGPGATPADGAVLVPPRPPPPEIREVPLFPLKTVSFPGGILSIKVFEQRYLDMASACLRSDECFESASSPAARKSVRRPSPIRSARWPASSVRSPATGHHEFASARRRALSHSGLRSRYRSIAAGRVELLRPPASTPLPETGTRLLPLLQRIVDELGDERIAPPHRTMMPSGSVTARRKPAGPESRQAELLELDDPLSRLEIIEKFSPSGVLG